MKSGEKKSLQLRRPAGFVGIEKGDARPQAEYLAAKVANLRIFEDETKK